MKLCEKFVNGCAQSAAIQPQMYTMTTHSIQDNAIFLQLYKPVALFSGLSIVCLIQDSIISLKSRPSP